ncbi:hypothetical protein T05_14591 [Trichinella murrelli]|uniref:Uncharacterized protein n=2 Tax=Trichinella TaxID=6333 RepID=A0A0V0T6G2_9BILA|nr:hypothetical protein T05_14591 [Trichinella murrelli]
MSLHSLPVLTAEKMFQEDVRLMKCPKIIRLDGVGASATCNEPSQCTQKALDRLVRDEFQVYGSDNHTCKQADVSLFAPMLGTFVSDHEGSSKVDPYIAERPRWIHPGRRQLTHPLLERTRCHSSAESTRAENAFNSTATTENPESFSQCRKSLSHTSVQLPAVLPFDQQIHDHPFAREQSWEFRFLFQLSSAKTSTDSHDPELIYKGIETAQRLHHRFVSRILRSESVDLLLPDPDSLGCL